MSGIGQVPGVRPLPFTPNQILEQGIEQLNLSMVQRALQMNADAQKSLHHVLERRCAQLYCAVSPRESESTKKHMKQNAEKLLPIVRDLTTAQNRQARLTSSTESLARESVVLQSQLNSYVLSKETFKTTVKVFMDAQDASAALLMILQERHKWIEKRYSLGDTETGKKCQSTFESLAPLVKPLKERVAREGSSSFSSSSSSSSSSASSIAYISYERKRGDG